MEIKYIRADLFWNKIAGSSFFSAVEKAKIQVAIEKEPSEDVAPVVHAHWDVIDQDSEGDEAFVHTWATLRCSRCGLERTVEDDYVPQYCEDCGAKMDEEKTKHEQSSFNGPLDAGSGREIYAGAGAEVHSAVYACCRPAQVKGQRGAAGGFHWLRGIWKSWRVRRIVLPQGDEDGDIRQNPDGKLHEQGRPESLHHRRCSGRTGIC